MIRGRVLIIYTPIYQENELNEIRIGPQGGKNTEFE